ncbi:MAG: SDR family oxidoreductase [Chloroflexi bacterium]|nr:SDR family oxidoreductase [Chloroflexota bacterium]
MTSKLILVTGATGYIASQLIPRLLERGYRVRTMARKPDQLKGRAWFSSVEVVPGDVMSSTSLASALTGVHTAYYLVHNMLIGRGYTAFELDGAFNFASAAADAGVEHVIYLGGLADPSQEIAPHLRSRIATGEVLRQGKVPVTEFRAGVIVGPGSISFEMIRFMTEQFPLLPGPNWLQNKSQPIAIQNILDYLLAALENPDGRGRIFEIGGPDVKVYADLMLTYAHLRGLHRWLFMLPGIPVWFMAWWIERLTPVPYRIARALVDGLRSDSVVRDDSAQRVFSSVKLIDYETAVNSSLAKLHPKILEPVWTDDARTVSVIKHEGFFVDHRRIEVNASSESVYRVLASMGGQSGWPYANWLWQLRGWLDKFFGGVGLRGRNDALKENDNMDYYHVDKFEPDHMMRLHSDLRAPGEGWMEWRVDIIPAEEAASAQTSILTQTAFFAPRGLLGFLYWYLLYPLHSFVFHGLIHAIAKQSESQ